VANGIVYDRGVELVFAVRVVTTRKRSYNTTLGVVKEDLHSSKKNIGTYYMDKKKTRSSHLSSSPRRRQFLTPSSWGKARRRRVVHGLGSVNPGRKEPQLKSPLAEKNLEDQRIRRGKKKETSSPSPPRKRTRRRHPRYSSIKRTGTLSGIHKRTNSPKSSCQPKKISRFPSQGEKNPRPWERWYTDRQQTEMEETRPLTIPTSNTPLATPSGRPTSSTLSKPEEGDLPHS